MPYRIVCLGNIEGRHRRAEFSVDSMLLQEDGLFYRVAAKRDPLCSRGMRSPSHLNKSRWRATKSEKWT